MKGDGLSWSVVKWPDLGQRGVRSVMDGWTDP